jgi:hypothetical protein
MVETIWNERGLEPIHDQISPTACPRRENEKMKMVPFKSGREKKKNSTPRNKVASRKLFDQYRPFAILKPNRRELFCIKHKTLHQTSEEPCRAFATGGFS